MTTAITIRRYQSGDAKCISQIYYQTIHTVNAGDYTAEQLNAWAPWSSVQNYRGWEDKLAKIKPFVALIDETIVGFAEFEPTGHIDCFYVHHAFQRTGIGSALMEAIEQDARDQALPRIFAEVSITARPFFEAKGYQVVRQQTVQTRGVGLINFVMEKCYTPGRPDHAVPAPA